MKNIYKSTMARGRLLLADPSDLQRLDVIAKAHQKRVNQLRTKVGNGNRDHADRITDQILRLPPGKICAVIRTAKVPPVASPISWAQLEERAAALDLTRPIGEPIRLVFKERVDHTSRPTLSFGSRRRAAQKLCYDILDVRLPKFEFDYLSQGKGANAATERLVQFLETREFQHVVTVDVENCFRSIDKGQVADLLPLPMQVANHALLVNDTDRIIVTPPENVSFTSLQSSQADEAARQGIPTGALLSQMVMARAILGPALASTSFAGRTILYGDDIAVPARDNGEANAIHQALSSLLETIPAGPLSIGRSAIQRTDQKVQFLKYAIGRAPRIFGGAVRLHPSKRSYFRCEEKARTKYVEGGDEALQRYLSSWTQSFSPLWIPNFQSNLYLQLLGLHAKAGFLFRPRSRPPE